MAQYTGEVAWFNNAKGFGFITPQTGPDIFVHFTAIEREGYRSLRDGDKVEFNVIEGTTGRPQAANVRVLEGRGVHPTGISVPELPAAEAS